MPDPNAVRWTALGRTVENSLGDANLLEFPDGQTFLIDAGEKSPGRLLTQLRIHHISHINGVVITKSEKKHYAGLLNLIKGRIAVGRIYVNGLDSSPEANQLQQILARRGIAVRANMGGDVFYSEGNVRLEMLPSLSGAPEPSASLLLTVGQMMAFFSGESMLHADRFLAQKMSLKDSNLVRMPYSPGPSSEVILYPTAYKVIPYHKVSAEEDAD